MFVCRCGGFVWYFDGGVGDIVGEMKVGEVLLWDGVE